MSHFEQTIKSSHHEVTQRKKNIQRSIALRLRRPNNGRLCQLRCVLHYELIVILHCGACCTTNWMQFGREAEKNGGRGGLAGGDIQDGMGIDGGAVVADFEVQVRAGGGAAGHTDQTDHITLTDALSAASRRLLHHVCV
jgi:hypothetical protein